MKKIEDQTLKLKSHSKSRAAIVQNYYHSEPIRIRFLHLYSPIILIAVLLLTTLVLGFSNRQAFIINISLTIFLIYTYISTRRSAYGVEIKRLLERYDFVEGEQLELKWSITNNSPLELCRYKVLDGFGPSQKGVVKKISEVPLAGYSQCVVAEQVTCNAGMGLRKIGPLCLEVRDAFGFFKFLITYDELIEANVYPKISKIREIEGIKVVESNQYGSYESPQSGHNVNFTGIRPFQDGDSLKHIAWKASAKHSQFMVKEFEKNVSCEVSVVLNLDPKVQVGHLENSTWEKSKKVALSLVGQNIDQGHNISLLTNSFYIESSHGEDHFHQICRRVSSISSFDSKEKKSEMQTMISTEKLIERSKVLLSHSHAIFWVATCNRMAERHYFEAIRDLCLKGKYVHIVLIDSESIMANSPEEVKILSPSHLNYQKNDLNKFARKLKQFGAKVDIVTVNQNLSHLGQVLREQAT